MPMTDVIEMDNELAGTINLLNSIQSRGVLSFIRIAVLVLNQAVMLLKPDSSLKIEQTTNEIRVEFLILNQSK